MRSSMGFADPFDYRLCGININQEEAPWWVTDVMFHIRAIKSIEGAYGAVGKRFRTLLKHTWDMGKVYTRRNKRTGTMVEYIGVHALVPLYEDFALAMEAEANAS